MVVGAGCDDEPSCSDLATQYEAALPAAETCTASADGQCAQPVDESLSVCGGCLTRVNDATMLNAIRARWTAVGCDNPKVKPPCAASSCVSPASVVCSPGASDHGGDRCEAPGAVVTAN